MPFTHRTALLQHQIDLISVPVFVVDECEDDQFRIAAINSAYATLTGLEKKSVHGRTLFDLIGNAVSANGVVGHYRHCLANEGPVSYRETIAFGREPMTFDTTLQKIVLPGGERHRIVGTAIRLEQEAGVATDIDFYLSLARNSLTTIEMLMNAGQDSRNLSVAEREATQILSRKALLSLDDIERAASKITTSDRPGDIEFSAAVRNLLLH